MNIKKYVNKSSLLLLFIVILIFTLIRIYINSEINKSTDNLVEKNMIDDVSITDSSKTLETVEKADDKVTTKIGEKELYVKSYYNTNVINNSIKNETIGVEKGIKEKWISAKPKREYQIGVLLPHFDDAYWIATNYGIINYAKELGVKIKLYSVGGYIEVGNQKEQLQALSKDNSVDGIIFAALDNTKFDSDVANSVNSGKPIVELVNDINAPKISAKALVSYYEMGYKAGEFIVKDSVGKDIKIAFFPGPEGSGWAPATYNGFKDAILNLKKENQKIDISAPYYGDSRPKVQLLRVVSVLQKNNDYDYVVGCAPATVQAEQYINKNIEKFKNVKIVSTYISNEVYDLIVKGTVLAAPSDQTIEQCRVALDMMVKILNGEKPGEDFPFQSGPNIPIISKENISQFSYEELFGTRDYIPVLNHMNRN
ncbi:MAG: TMAO reductase system periplasmic protein TorT [Clostridiaceae bacterium]